MSKEPHLSNLVTQFIQYKQKNKEIPKLLWDQIEEEVYSFVRYYTGSDIPQSDAEEIYQTIRDEFITYILSPNVLAFKGDSFPVVKTLTKITKKTLAKYRKERDITIPIEDEELLTELEKEDNKRQLRELISHLKLFIPPEKISIYLKILYVCVKTIGVSSVLTNPNSKYPIEFRALACTIYSLFLEKDRLNFDKFSSTSTALALSAFRDELKKDKDCIIAFTALDPKSIVRLTKFYGTEVQIKIPKHIGSASNTSTSPSLIKILFLLTKRINKTIEKYLDLELDKIIFLDKLTYIIDKLHEIVNTVGGIKVRLVRELPKLKK